MAYKAEISRSNPTCFLFLVDHSTSMQDPIMGVSGNPRKSEFVADAINKVIQSLIVSASKDLEIRNYYQVGIIGYGFEVKSLWAGELQEQKLPWIEDIYKNPLRIEDRIWKDTDENGEEIAISIKFPVWIEPVSRGQTPMCSALKMATEILQEWVDEHPESYPPTVINLTDGESNDGDAKKTAEDLKTIATEDGNVVLLTVHTSSNPYSEQLFFPGKAIPMPDHFSKVMFSMSSELPEGMRNTASELTGLEISPDARGFVYNAEIAGIVQALEIGTRPSNLP